MQYKQHLEIVFKTLQERSLYGKMSKYEFGMKELLYLGHIIGKDGVKVYMENIRSILEWPLTKKHHRSKRLHWNMYILQEVCDRVFQVDFSTHLFD